MWNDTHLGIRPFRGRGRRFTSPVTVNPAGGEQCAGGLSATVCLDRRWRSEKTGIEASPLVLVAR